MIRPAKSVDIPAIVDLLQEAQAKSKYASCGGIDETYTKQLLHRLILGHGGKSVDGTHCMVEARGAEILGIHFGMKDRIALIAKEYMATDIFFYVSKKASPFAAVALLDSFTKWASSDARVVKLQPGVTNIINDHRPVAAFYRRNGYEECGIILERNIKHEARVQ